MFITLHTFIKGLFELIFTKSIEYQLLQKQKTNKKWLKSNSMLFWNCFARPWVTTRFDWLKKSHYFSQSAEMTLSEKQKKGCKRFPMLYDGCAYLLRVILFGSFYCSRPLQLSNEITLVMVWRHSINNSLRKGVHTEKIVSSILS